jgi:hypothetical protein
VVVVHKLNKEFPEASHVELEINLAGIVGGYNSGVAKVSYENLGESRIVVRPMQEDVASMEVRVIDCSLSLPAGQGRPLCPAKMQGRKALDHACDEMPDEDFWDWAPGSEEFRHERVQTASIAELEIESMCVSHWTMEMVSKSVSFFVDHLWY